MTLFPQYDMVRAIAQDKVNNIFEPFTQVDNETNRRYPTIVKTRG